MKRFLIDFIIAFFIIVFVFGMSGTKNEDFNPDLNYDEEVIDKDEEIENIKDYDGNLINRISFKINGLIQNIADFGFDLFKKGLKTFLD